MLRFEYSNSFKKDYKRAIKRGKDITKLDYVMSELIKQSPLEAHHRQHMLTGDYYGYMECHIEPDWLLVYKISGDLITFSRTGRHADLFKGYS